MNIQGEDNTFDIRIFFPNGAAVQALVENDSTANDLIRLMIKHLEIDDYSAGEEALAIWFVSPLLEIQLKPCQIPYKIYQKWPAFLTRFTNAEDHEILLDEPLLVLRRNVLLTLDREIQLISKYEKLAEVLYFDARDKYLSGRYSVDIESSLELVGLQLAIGFGPCNGNYNKMIDLIYDNLTELAPYSHTKLIKSFRLFGLSMMECRKGLENQVIDEYRIASTHFHNNHERYIEFLKILGSSPSVILQQTINTNLAKKFKENSSCIFSYLNWKKTIIDSCSSSNSSKK
ncbi:hypothetical protein ACQ4LE_004734 [Meloidogyne hapla]